MAELNSPDAIQEPLLSLVVPTRNEAENATALLDRLQAVLGNLRAEVLVVDDSTDNTPELVERWAAASGRALSVRVVHRPAERRTGLGSAVVDGMKLARGRVIGVMDGDLQHPPELLPEMLAALGERDLDVVVASRYLPGGSPSGLNGPGRRIVSAVSRRASQALFREGRKTSDPLSGFFLCRQSAVEGLEFRPIGFKILLEILVCAPDARVGDVPLRFQKRHGGRSNASVTQGWAFIRHLYELLVQVRGSARSWKYALVGGIGLSIFLGLLYVGRALELPPLLSWAVAFTVSLAVNWQLNQLFTFADVASPFSHGRSRPVYLPVALLGGVANFVVFALLVGRVPLTAAGLAGATAAMAINYTVHRSLLRRSPVMIRFQPGLEGHLVQALRVALPGTDFALLGSEAGEVELAKAFGPESAAPPELLRAARERKPILLSEAPSHVPQVRQDIGVKAWLASPLIGERSYRGLLLGRREGRPFSLEELQLVMATIHTESREELPNMTPLLGVDQRPPSPT